MDSLIQISKLNDFLYSPKSLYFHSVYEDFDSEIFHESAQKRGKIAHESIDKGEYSSATKYLQGIPVFNEKYGIVGKIDVYDKETKTLIERKYNIKQIHLGYLYQLWAEMFCLQEMGHEVKKLYLHSLKDNKRYEVKPPTNEELQKFEETIDKIRNYDVQEESKHWKTDEIDDKTIYSPLYF